MAAAWHGQQQQQPEPFGAADGAHHLKQHLLLVLPTIQMYIHVCSTFIVARLLQLPELMPG